MGSFSFLGELCPLLCQNSLKVTKSK